MMLQLITALVLHVGTSLGDSEECQLILSKSFSWTTKGFTEYRCLKQFVYVQGVYLTITYWQNKSSRLSIYYAWDSLEQLDKGQD